MATRGDAHLAMRDEHGGSAVRFRAAGTAAGDSGAVATVDAARVAGRYHLQDRVGEAGESAVWKAFDDVLGRPVTVRTFAPGSAGGDIAAAARAACRITDHRLERLFDADGFGAGAAYIVTEWADAECLEDILATRCVDVTWAARVIAEAASALAAAHAAGIPHLCLTLRSLRWSDEAGLKITGLGVEAALKGRAAGLAAGQPPEALSPAERTGCAWTAGQPITAANRRADTCALAQLLYAALTGHWPGRWHPVLPAAPHRHGRPYRPRQIRAGVPAWIDEITCRALFEPAARGAHPVTSPREFADLLNAAVQHEMGQPGPVKAAPANARPPSDVAYARRPVWLRRRRTHALAGGLVGALFVIDSALIGTSFLGAGHAPPPIRHVAAAPQAAASRPHDSQWPAGSLRAASAQAFDPYGGSEDENNGLAPAVIDGNPGTFWHTFWYTTERFGNLKPGTGLLLDMGRRVTISRVRVLLGAVPGADVELRIGNDTGSLGDLPVTARADGAGGLVTLRPAVAHRGRYVLIWFTRLPPQQDSSGLFQADVYDVEVRGLAHA